MSGPRPPIPSPSPSPSKVEVWEDWDIRVLILCVIFAQLCLHVLGSLRKWKIRRRINVTIWLEKGPKPDVNILRVLWAPTILFYLGGPDTITVSSLGEANTWVRHFIGLSIQGVRISNIMWVAWTDNELSLVALLMLFPGIIKYGEKLWTIWSRNEGHSKGFVRSDDLDQHTSNINRARPESELVLRAYSYLQTLKPHNLKYFCDWEEQKKVVTSFNKWIEEKSAAKNAFKLMEIELGLMHDMLFNRIGTIFTKWGCISRFISLSFLVCILWMFCNDVNLVFIKYTDPSEWVDPLISLILLLGAIFLDVAGVAAQIFSDWAVIWASRHQSKLLNPVLHLQEHFISKSKRWSGFIGQCDFLTFRNLIKMAPRLKDLIINQLLEKWQSNAEQSEHLPTLAMRRGACTENQNDIVTWHIVTEIYYRLSKGPDKDNSEKVEATKTLSHYMMYLLLKCPSNLPFCNTSRPVKESCGYVKDILRNKGSKDKENEDRWKIMSNIWVDMLSYAASNCPIRQHARDVRNGGQFLTHVWLLLLHLGVIKRLDFNSSQNLIEPFLEKSSELYEWLLLLHV
ncbi:hypothetical protein NMG60_11023245 [Bertholletia excelsa]